MPAKATQERRLEWHLAHAVACGCRPIPAPLRQLMAERGMALPKAAGPARDRPA